MDDSCAVCAETLEWVAYGPCGHREVCSTCVVRLRFICHDRRCCICKTESDTVFITKALGDYTRMINDFSLLPSDLREGRVGSYWYHEDTNAFFDDLDHYKMVKEMCRLSCSVCDQLNEQSNDASKKRAKFRNIEQLKGHLFHRHRLIMCSLCLEGRKIFICEQKLYTKAQLNQHINTGDSEVDGSESDRGGFTGHPMCEFCRTPFYGDNELFTHMTTEHYTCHICQRHHPGQYEYYKNYDDLEIHFRREHFLCEDDACLAKKFTVFQSEGEMKRHNAIEHGGRMSRAQRNAALQIPTSFRYQRSNEQGHRRGRGGRTFHRETSENQLSMAVQASLDMANSASSFHDPSSSSNPQVVYDHGDEIDPLVKPFDSLTTNDIDPPSRYLQAMSKSRNTRLEESSFPPLPGATTSTNQQNPSRSLPMNTLTSQQAFPSLRLGNIPIKKKNNRASLPSSSNPSNQSIPEPNDAPVSSSSSPQIKHAISRGPVPTNAPVSTPAWPAVGQGHVSASTYSRNPASLTNNTPVSLSSTVQIKPAMNNESLKSGYVSSILAWPAIDQGHSSSGSSSSSRKSSRTSSITHSASAPNLAERSFDSSDSQFPPVSATQIPKSSTPLIVKDVHSANKTLVEKMRAALEFDEEKYNAFKDISGQYRQGVIHTAEYLAYVHQFGLSDLIPDLARLCPDAQKQKELLDTYNTNIQNNGLPGNGKGSEHISSKKNKGKATNPKSSLADSVMTSVRELQSSYKHSDIEVEELSKDGYRVSRGKSTMTIVDQEQAKSNEKGGSPSSGADGPKQKQKKSSKFHRMRLGDGSVDAYLYARKYDSDPDPEIKESSADGKTTAEGLPVRGVWRRGGGQKLIGTASKDPSK